MRRYIIYSILLVSCLALQAEDLIYIERSNTLEFDQARLPDAQILKGDVCFRHDSTWMYCDSAYFYDERNSLDAFGHVRFIQGDSLAGYGDVLYYDGNTQIARFRKHVKLVHRSTILTTDSLNYDRKKDIAYYLWGGQIVDSLNTLTSKRGQYTPNNRMAVFRKQVLLTNPNFTLESDTLKYNTETNIAYLVSPTKIVYEEETTILSSNGTYNTQNEQSHLFDRSQIIHQDHKMMTGDTIFYDKRTGFGMGWSNVLMSDTANHVNLYGNYCEAWEKENRSMATDSALIVDWSDSLYYTYMHADTLFVEEIDSIKYMRAYHNVRVYREDAQAVCDSLFYDGKDSVMHLFTDPVCWNDSNQMSADSIRIYVVNEKVDHIFGIGAAVMVQQSNDSLFNQMSGKQMTAFVRDDEIKEVEVKGNALTIYYPKEDKGDYIGMNTTESSTINIYLVNRQIDYVRFTSETNGTIYPLDQIPEGADHLDGFFWAEQERPLKPGDVFLRPERTPRPRKTVMKL